MKYQQVIRFLFVGATSAATQFIVLAFVYEVCKAPLNWAVTIAYIVSVIVHFAGNKHFTFYDTGQVNIAEVIRYLAVVLSNYLITIFIVWFIVDILIGSLYVATMTSIAATAISGFMLSKFWVFRKVG